MNCGLFLNLELEVWIFFCGAHLFSTLFKLFFISEKCYELFIIDPMLILFDPTTVECKKTDFTYV